MNVKQFFSEEVHPNSIRNRLEMEFHLDYLLTHLKTVENALDYISKKFDIPIEIEEDTKTFLSQNLCYLDSLNVKKISILEFFHIIFPPQNIKWVIANNKIYVQCANPNKMILKTYDISDLVSSTFHGENNLKDHVQIFGENPDNLEIKDEYYSRWEIMNLVKNKVLSQYKYNNALVSVNTGKLFISHFLIVHKHVEAFLNELRKLSCNDISIHINFISFKNNFFKQSKIVFSPIIEQEEKNNFICLFSILNKKERKDFFSSVNESSNAENIFEEKLLLNHLKTKTISKPNKTDFLAGQHCENNIGRMFSGIIVKVFPEINKNGITLELEVKIIEISRPIVTFPIEGGEIAVPNQTIQTIKTRIQIPDEHTLILAGFCNPFDKKNDKSFTGNHKQENLMLCIDAQIDNFFELE